MKLINLTPHSIRILTSHGEKTIPRSKVIARCDEKRVQVTEIDGIPIYMTQFSEVKNLPPEQEGTFLVVSKVVASAAKDRNDLLIPDSLVRAPDGAIIGCKGLCKVKE